MNLANPLSSHNSKKSLKNRTGSPRLLTFNHIIKNRYLYIMLIPVMLWYLLFCYLPMYGITLAFREFSYNKGFFDSPFVGFANFKELFNDTTFVNALKNTVIINSLRILFGFPVPIIFALLLNEIFHIKFKRVVQTITYLPHFISWVALAGIMNSILALDSGALNVILRSLGFEQVDFLMDNSYFRGTLIVSDIWKEMGWNTIIYLAAIAGINPDLYEAAVVDGAGRWKRIWKVTLPCIQNTMVIMLILQLGYIMQMGFEQIYNLYNAVVYETGDILDTYIVRNLMQNPRYGVQAAAGLVKSVISFVMLVIANNIAKMMGQEGIY